MDWKSVFAGKKLTKLITLTWTHVEEWGVTPLFLFSALDGAGRHQHDQPLYAWEWAPGTQWMEGWVGPRTGIDAGRKRKISWPCWESKAGSSLYQLSYPNSHLPHRLYTFKHHTMKTVKTTTAVVNRVSHFCKEAIETWLYFSNGNREAGYCLGKLRKLLHAPW
jgi:hypothetical protein